MALYQRGRVWYADYYANGERVQESTGKTNRREAEKFIALRISEVERDVYAKPVRIALLEFGERYIAHARRHKRSWRRDIQMLGHLVAFLGNVNLGEIGPLRIERYQEHRLKKVRPATVNRELALLKHMFNLAEKWDLFQEQNPVRRVKFLAEDNLRFHFLGEDEERKLLVYSPPYLREMILFALNSGLRSGEIFHLTWQEVNLDQRTITPIARKTRRPLELPLNDTAHGILVCRNAVKHGPYVFYNAETGTRFKDVKAGLQAAVKRAGLRNVTWHTFRHTFASRLTQNGVDLVTVKELLGHSTINVTMRYAHSHLEAKARAVAKLPSSDKIVRIVPKGAIRGNTG